MATGRLPFSGATTTETLNRILNSQPEAIARFNYNVPPELERIIRKCLEKDPESRYQSCRELLVDLKNSKRDTTTVPPTAVESVRVSAKKPRTLWISIVLIALILSGWFIVSRTLPNRKAIDSIAVLPFLNVSSDANVDYLSDGITESIIKNLSQIQKLKVLASASVFRYKGTKTDPLEAGKQLKVSAILTGKLVQHGDQIVVSADLVNVSDGSELWGEQYNRPLADVLKLQEEISRTISEKLRLKLTGEEEKRVTKHYTENSEAYQNYLKARYHWNQRSEEGIKKGIEYFQKAIELDPNYALAYSGLADSYCVDGAPFPWQERVSKSRVAAEKAIQLDDSLAEGHTSMGCVLHNDFNWPALEAEFKKALALNPNYATAHQWYAQYLVVGPLHRQEAISEVKRAAELDPLSPIIQRCVIWVYFFGGFYDEAAHQARKTAESDEFSVQWLLLSLEAQGKFEEAIQEGEKWAVRSGRPKDFIKARVTEIRNAYSKSGKEGYYRTILRWDTERPTTSGFDMYEIASEYAVLDEKENAFAWLEKAFETNPAAVLTIKADYRFDNIRSDPRYEGFLKRMHF